MEKPTTKLEHILIMFEYLDVFPNELSRLPLDKEIEFEINFGTKNLAYLYTTLYDGANRIKGVELTIIRPGKLRIYSTK